MPDAPLSLRALNRATLARQMLLAREKTSPLAAIERLVGMQAQIPKPPFIGLWTRLERFRREDLLKLLGRREAVRATAMRCTIHLLSARDYLALRPQFEPALTKGMRSVLGARTQALDLAQLAVEARALFGERPRTFAELRDALAAAHPEADIRAMGYAIRLSLPLVQVPDDESTWGFPGNADFALAESWLGAPIPEGPASPETLVLRYLAAFGPASPADAQSWSGMAGLREIFEALRPRLVAFRDERKRELFDLPKAPRPPEDSPAPIRFLPEFDNLLLGHQDRRRVVADEHRKPIYLAALRVASTVLVDGFARAVWSAERKKDAATLTVRPLARLARELRREIEEEGERLLRFLEPDAEKLAVRFDAK